MKYGVIVNGQLIIHKSKHQGDKPITMTSPPETADDEILSVYYEDGESEILERWIVTKNEYEPIMPTVEEMEEKALVRYANELTGAEDETLTEATETLIKQLKEGN